MIPTKRIPFAVLVSVLFSVFAVNAHAASSVLASAEIDWGSLTIQTTDSLMVEIAPDGLDVITVTANSASDGTAPVGTLSSLGDSQSATSPSGSVTSSGSTDPLGSGGIVASTQATTPTPNAFDFGSSAVSRLLAMTATEGSGTLLISLDFTVSGEVVGSSPSPANIGAIAGVFFGQVIGTPDGGFVFIDGVFNEVRVADGSQTVSGTLTYEIDLQAGDMLSFAASAQVQARNAVIPLPASLYFLGSGLIGLIGWGRRRNA